MTVLLVIATTAILASLALSVTVCKGCPVSVSAVYYVLEDGGRRVFQMCMAAMAPLLYATWIHLGKDIHLCLAFLACASLLYVAFSPEFKEELQGKVHYTAAAVCCASVFLWQVLEGLWDVTLWFVWVAGMLTLNDRSKWCWWLECAAIGSLLANMWRLVL